MPGLLARRRLLHLDVEAALLGPAQVHAQQHLGPVLGVGAARAAVHRDDRVAGVVAAAEQALLLELGHARARRAASCSVELVAAATRPRRRARPGRRGRSISASSAAERLEPARGAAVLGRDRRRPLLVVPEAGLLHLGLERGDALRSSAGGSKVVREQLQLVAELRDARGGAARCCWSAIGPIA